MGVLSARTPARRQAWSPSFAVLIRLMIDGPGAEDNLRGQASARIVGSQPVTFGYRIARRADQR